VTGHSAESSANGERGLLSSSQTMEKCAPNPVNKISKLFLASRADRTKLP
jgi:hypothetical protein